MSEYTANLELQQAAGRFAPVIGRHALAVRPSVYRRPGLLVRVLRSLGVL